MSGGRIAALLDRPSARSLGMLGIVLRGVDGILSTVGVLGSQGGVLTQAELEDLARGGHAVLVDGPVLESSASSWTALWVGVEFAEQAERQYVALPPLPVQKSGRIDTGQYWVAPTKHVWRVLDSWIAHAFRRAVVDRNEGLSRLMAWAMPDRVETRAVNWLTATSPDARTRDLHWWTRLSRDRGHRSVTQESLTDEFERRIHEAETSPRSTVIGFCAPAKGGDKQIARFVEKQLSTPTLSFGDWLRTQVEREGRIPGRRMLQERGQQIISTRGALSFCLDVLIDKLPTDHQQRAFTIEGIRHQDVLDSVKSLVGPDRFFLAFVDRPVHQREELLRSEEGLQEWEIRLVLEDETEQEIPRLRRQANIELNAQLSAASEGKRLIENLPA